MVVPVRTNVLEAHRYLAVRDLPDDSAILRGDSHRGLPLFGKLGVVQREDSALGGEPRRHDLDEASLDEPPVPRRVGDEVLQSVRRDPCSLGERLHALAVPIDEKAEEIGAGIGAGLLGSRPYLEQVIEGGEEVGEFREPVSDLGRESGSVRRFDGQGCGEGRHPSSVVNLQ
jgi:hypothetical protein